MIHCYSFYKNNKLFDLIIDRGCITHVKNNPTDTIKNIHNLLENNGIWLSCYFFEKTDYIPNNVMYDNVNYYDDYKDIINVYFDITYIEYIDKNINNPNIDWYYISLNPNITMEFIEKYPDKPWDWGYISQNPNITIEFIEKYHDKPWNWKALSGNKFQKDYNLMKKMKLR